MARPRPCGCCGRPTLLAELLQTHLGPTARLPRADRVVWLCWPCAATGAARSLIQASRPNPPERR
jgi:hypothetical protein